MARAYCLEMAPRWSAASDGSAFLAKAVIEVGEDGVTVVVVNGAPRCAYPSLAQFLEAWELRVADIAPSPSRPSQKCRSIVTRRGYVFRR